MTGDIDTFTRILHMKPRNGEEMRADETDADRYHGLAPDGTDPARPLWAIVRNYKTDLGLGQVVTRIRYRENTSWNDRANPLNWP